MTDPQPPAFLFVTCQVGAEATLKAEMARLWPSFHSAFSRPGFVTFKLPPGHHLPDDFELRSVFARAYGFSLGKVAATDLADGARQVWQLAGKRVYDALHVWQRDTATPGFRGFEPHATPEAHEAEVAIRAWSAAAGGQAASHPRIAGPGQRVLDCILVEPQQWWVGYHRATASSSSWPGGCPELALPPDAVSRAYLKMEEALLWSALPIRAGQRFAEIGCAPGGASQALLAHGLVVIGIDPAQVDPRVLADPRFTHIQKRGADVRRREFRNVRWLAADVNVAPEYTLDMVEAIVNHPSVNIRGLLLTLKLSQWEWAQQIAEYVDRVGSWGYGHVRTRQLAYNRQEICIAARRREPRRHGPIERREA